MARVGALHDNDVTPSGRPDFFVALGLKSGHRMEGHGNAEMLGSGIVGHWGEAE